jgi:hypothetical protein
MPRVTYESVRWTQSRLTEVNRTGQWEFNNLRISIFQHILFPQTNKQIIFIWSTRIYEGESVNKPQMDIKRKTCDIWTWKKHSFLDIPSTSIDTHDTSLYKSVETRSIKVLWLLSQPLPHLRFNLFVISETFFTLMWTALRDKHFPP